MNEQLQQALSELIIKATTGIDTASEFILAELPDVIYQLLMWHGVRSLLIAIACIVIFIIATVGNYKFYKYASKEDYWEQPYIFGNIFISMIYIPCVCGFNITWLKIWIAPKVWLIEYAANLVK